MMGLLKKMGEHLGYGGSGETKRGGGGRCRSGETGRAVGVTGRHGGLLGRQGGLLGRQGGHWVLLGKLGGREGIGCYWGNWEGVQVTREGNVGYWDREGSGGFRIEGEGSGSY